MIAAASFGPRRSGTSRTARRRAAPRAASVRQGPSWPLPAVRSVQLRFWSIMPAHRGHSTQVLFDNARASRAFVFLRTHLRFVNASPSVDSEMRLLDDLRPAPRLGLEKR